MSMVAKLTDYDPDNKESEEAFSRAQLRLQATGIDTAELYEKNGEPSE